MKRKRYEVRGMMEWHPVFKVGRSSLRVSFTGGHLCGGASTPAYYETADPVVQTVIESSAEFRSKRIRLAMEKFITEPVKEPVCPVRANTDSVNPDTPGSPSAIFEYTKEEDIYEYLEQKKGIPVEQLCDMDSCFLEAERLGVTLVKKTSVATDP
ncbi:MAG: hypothetical protein K2G77_05340 [Muribaculaceae bacterium]|nr:hypothetical protein [Muribaculaceae bacterium]